METTLHLADIILGNQVGAVSPKYSSGNISLSFTLWSRFKLTMRNFFLCNICGKFYHLNKSLKESNSAPVSKSDIQVYEWCKVTNNLL